MSEAELAARIGRATRQRKTPADCSTGVLDEAPGDDQSLRGGLSFGEAGLAARIGRDIVRIKQNAHPVKGGRLLYEAPGDDLLQYASYGGELQRLRCLISPPVAASLRGRAVAKRA